jgi:hypothetical protein
MTERSQTLKSYEVFISEIHENLNAGIDLGSAIHKAIKVYTQGNYSLDFLMKHGSEVENMLLNERKLEDALAVAKEEKSKAVIFHGFFGSEKPEKLTPFSRVSYPGNSRHKVYCTQRTPKRFE